MDWTKVKTKHFLYSDYTLAERGAFITLLLLTAHLEDYPSEKQMLHHTSKHTLDSIRSKLGDSSMTLREVLGKVLMDVRAIRGAKIVSCTTSQTYRNKQKSDKSRDDTDKIREDKIRKDSKEIQKKKPTEKEVEDAFNLIWKQYPKKDGRKAALNHFRASVKTEEDYKNIQIALSKYKKYIEIEKKEYQYIKQGSTWFNNWKDWIDYDLDLLKGGDICDGRSDNEIEESAGERLTSIFGAGTELFQG